ncbi:MAG: undecaprenyl-phosphate alpha-N-acetylglucosaminyl 1-phosphate transferase [Candidatus Dormiibacter spiritus]|nr:MAG: undecaprenyl-phosphate alpha-N-acetylglucosaminyl 1-phosphate transferase [Candidatus Dormibacteraeota bacterium]
MNELSSVLTDLFNQSSLTALQANLGPALIPALVALGACLIATPLAIRLSPALGLVARPNRERDIHRGAVPKMGGFAMFVAFALAVLIFLPHSWSVLGVLVLCGVSALLYALDDRFDIPALAKLGLQIVVAVVAVKLFGFEIRFLHLPFLEIPNLGLLILPVSVFWVIGMQNTVNLLDGVDGLAAGVVAIVAVVLMVSVFGRPAGLPAAAQHQVLILAACLAAVCVGFLVFNFNPARIFMGDSGAHFLGMALALLSILSVAKIAVAAALLVPLLALAVPIGDTAWAIFRRRRQGLSIAHADSNHVHHQLLDFGLSQRETCLLFYGATGILGAAGLALLGAHQRLLAAAVVVTLVIVSSLLGERLRLLNRRVPVPGGRVIRLFLEGRSARN